MSSQTNPYVPFPSKVLEVVRHTKKEYTFRMAFAGDVRPGQFFEVSVPKFGEAPISVSGIVPGESVDLTIRRVGRVTNEMFDTTPARACFCAGRTATASTWGATWTASASWSRAAPA